MKSGVIVFTTVVATLGGLIVPVSAQLPNRSQEFFEWGREQLEQEIQILQGNPSNPDKPLQATEEPILDISPSPESTPSQQPEHSEPLSQQSDEANKSW